MLPNCTTLHVSEKVIVLIHFLSSLQELPESPLCGCASNSLGGFCKRKGLAELTENPRLLTLSWNALNQSCSHETTKKTTGFLFAQRKVHLDECWIPERHAIHLSKNLPICSADRPPIKLCESKRIPPP